MTLIKPKKLQPGDKVAAISLSWGGAGEPDILWRYEQGKKRLQEEFGLDVMEMPNTLKGAKYLYEHPEKRAEDLIQAFADPSIKGIFSCIGGTDSIRLLPYIDFDIIAKNPKVFIGYSDTTITHFICYKAGISSFYGASILAEFAENVQIFDYTKHWVQKTLFDASPIGHVEPSPGWTSELLPWDEKNKAIQRRLQENTGYELLQGQGKVQGRLIGGCTETLEMMKGTELWPEPSAWEDSILFLETSEDKPDPIYVECWLRNYGAMGVLNKTNAILFAKPYDNYYYDDYKEAILKVLKEFGLPELPVLYNMNFGHTAPMCVLPYGALAEIDCEAKSFSILECGVV